VSRYIANPKHNMANRLQRRINRIWKEKLPGVDKYIDEHEEIHCWIENKKAQIDEAYREAHEPAFERAISSYSDGFERVNCLLAERYKLANTEPGSWELRYLRWMDSIVRISCTSKWGDFTIYRVRPAGKVDGNWTTVDRMIDACTPSLSRVLEVFDIPPFGMESRAPGPGNDENHLHIEPQAQKVWTVFGKRTDFRIIPNDGH